MTGLSTLIIHLTFNKCVGADSTTMGELLMQRKNQSSVTGGVLTTRIVILNASRNSLH